MDGPPGAQREARLFTALDADGSGRVAPAELLAALADAGLDPDDARLAAVRAALPDAPMDVPTFSRVIAPASRLVERALQGGLAVADFAHFRARAQAIFDEVAADASGTQATYIPPLAEVDPDHFGVAVMTVDGQQLALGDADVDLSLQSTCKPFSYCIALEDVGEEVVHRHIGREPSGQRYNAYVLQDDHRPHNPMINAGAIVCAALIKQGLPLHRRFDHIRDMIARLTGGSRPRFNAYMAQEEARTGDRNRALAYMMKNEGTFPDGRDTEDHQVRAALDLYFRSCSLELTTREIAVAAATLAAGGVCPTTQERVLGPRTVRHCLALMHSCGMYDYSGEFAFRIGLPAKSGVGGAVMVVVPRILGMCIWSPRLDRIGNSVRGVAFARRLTEVYSLHVYDGVSHHGERLDPGVPRARWAAAQVGQALWAASTGDVGTVRRMLDEGMDLGRADYDRRTPLHLAAAEGHGPVVQVLLEAGVPVDPRDRWGGTPLDAARRAAHADVAAALEGHGATGGAPDHAASEPSATDIPAHHADADAVVELLYAAAAGDLGGLRRLVAQGVPMHAADVDGRTALHLAAAEGQAAAARYLLAHGHPRNVRDRWGATPLDEARREGRAVVVGLLGEG